MRKCPSRTRGPASEGAEIPGGMDLPKSPTRRWGPQLASSCTAHKKKWRATRAWAQARRETS
eukprot:2054911-Pyramimonas_sp.AAC.1